MNEFRFELHENNDQLSIAVQGEALSVMAFGLPRGLTAKAMMLDLGPYDVELVAMIRDVADAEVARVKGEGASWRAALELLSVEADLDQALIAAVALNSDSIEAAANPPEARMVPTVAADRCEAMDRVVRDLVEWADKHPAGSQARAARRIPKGQPYTFATILDDARAALGDA